MDSLNTTNECWSMMSGSEKVVRGKEARESSPAAEKEEEEAEEVSNLSSRGVEVVDEGGGMQEEAVEELEDARVLLFGLAIDGFESLDIHGLDWGHTSSILGGGCAEHAKTRITFQLE